MSPSASPSPTRPSSSRSSSGERGRLPLPAAPLPGAKARRMTPTARSEVQRILDAEARRILAARLEGDSIAAATRRDEGTREDGLDDPAAGLEAQALPISSGVENDGGSVDGL